MGLTNKDLSARLSRRLANFKIKDAVIAKLADRVMIDGLEIKRFDVCIYGICIDYHTDKLPKLESIFSRTDVSRFEVFPYGILEWDHFHVHVGYSIDELAGVGGVGGVGR